MTTRKLRLGPLPKTESTKLTFACPASLKADLDRYATLPEYRGRGIGTSLLALGIFLLGLLAYFRLPVAPLPQKMTQSSVSLPPTAWRMIWRALSRNVVVCRPVPLVSVCVFA